MKKVGFIFGIFTSFAWATVVSAQVSTPSGLASELDSTSQGAVIGLYGVNPINCPEVSMSQTWDGGRLIFSDSPESPTTRGMLYKDITLTATTGTNRIFVYHANGNSSGSLKFSVLIKNNGVSSGTLTVKQSGWAGPSTDYPLVGELTFYRWLTNTTTKTQTVSAGAVVRLDTNFDSQNSAYTYAINGIWDYTFNQPHTIMICALNPSDNPVTVGPTLSVLARDTHERGTFSACNKIYDTAAGVNIDPTNGIVQFPIGGNGDVAVTGYDEAVSPATLETNDGNYGLLYRSHLNSTSSNGKNFGLLINPRSGGWCGAIWTESGILAGGKFVIPSDGGTFSSNTNAAVAGEYNSGSGFQMWMQFMPTAGAAFPVRVVVVPY